MHLKNSNIDTEAILESISDGVFTVNSDWIITFFNQAAEKITGIPRNEAVGKLCAEVFRSNMCETGCALRRTIESQKPVIQKTCYIIHSSGEKIPISVSTAILRDLQGNICGGAETFRDLSELENLRNELKNSGISGKMHSRNPQMNELFSIIKTAADTSATILILGETGTGKEVAARQIHALSPRASLPFAAINCAAIPETLLESELFGYKKGAFTGAFTDKPGKFSEAAQGTLFLDEIGEMPLSLQAKILRVLQERSFEPLGSQKSIPLQARIIAASNRNLLKMVKENLFRADLYYRLNIIKLEIPPLKGRIEDIPFLADYFLKKYCMIHSRNIRGFTPEVLQIFFGYSWPGNVRELENTVEQACILCQNEIITPDCIPDFTAQTVKKPEQKLLNASHNLEHQIIVQTLATHNYNCTQTAKELGIHRATLYRKIKKFNIVLPSKNTDKNSASL